VCPRRRRLRRSQVGHCRVVVFEGKEGCDRGEGPNPANPSVQILVTCPPARYDAASFGGRNGESGGESLNQWRSFGENVGRTHTQREWFHLSNRKMRFSRQQAYQRTSATEGMKRGHVGGGNIREIRTAFRKRKKKKKRDRE
jgi:hypothetical protein